jgi:hypothetical protein
LRKKFFSKSRYFSSNKEWPITTLRTLFSEKHWVYI